MSDFDDWSKYKYVPSSDGEPSTLCRVCGDTHIRVLGQNELRTLPDETAVVTFDTGEKTTLRVMRKQGSPSTELFSIYGPLSIPQFGIPFP